MVLSILMKGEPAVTKMAKVSMYAVFPGAMIASLIYSPPNYASWKKSQSSISK